MRAEKQQEQQSSSDFLSLCTVDMTAKTYDSVIGREKEVDKLIEILCRKNKSNPLLLGEPGVGKTAVVYDLVNRIKSGLVPSLEGRKIRSLDLALLSDNLKSIKFILDDISKSGDILFIDEIHNIVGAGKASGSLDVANIMKPLLSGSDFACIGATTLEEYKLYFEKDSALERRFSKVLIEEPTVEEAITILGGVKNSYEKHHDVKIDQSAIECAVTYSVRYLTDRQLPDKAFDLLDEACSQRSLDNKTVQNIHRLIEKYKAEADWEKVGELTHSILPNLKSCESDLVTDKEIMSVVSDKTGIPVAKMNLSDRERLLHIEDHLKKRVVGQDQVLKVLADSIRTTRVGLNQDTTSMLFLGSTGVGKTEVAKALAEFLFDSEDSMIRLDMSEYKESHSVSKLIGSPAGYVGYEEGGQLTEAVKRKPYSVILLDEVEKAHVEVWDVFLQVLDEGRLTDNKGRTVDFKNTIIIMTSNLKKDKLNDFFRAEFLNRISSIVTFNSLNKETLQTIVEKQLDILSDKLKSKHNIELCIKENLFSFLVEKSFGSKEFGARPIKRYIKDNLESMISKKILEDESLEGGSLILSLTDIDGAV